MTTTAFSLALERAEEGDAIAQTLLGVLTSRGLGVKQDLAAAAEVTDSYISQLLTRKKLPPAPDRTDIYDKMGRFLKLSGSKLAELASAQRAKAIKSGAGQPPAPLFLEVRETILRKCAPEKQQQVREIFQQQPFGEFERFVTQNLLDVIKRVARKELDNDVWLQAVARLSRHSYKQMRVIILQFLDTDIFSLSGEDCASFLDPLINSWDIDLSTFSLEIVLNQRLVVGQLQHRVRHRPVHRLVPKHPAGARGLR